MTTPCHIIVADNPAIVYLSRGGTPKQILPMLQKFLAKFWQERDISGEDVDTPACLVAQLAVLFAFKTAEDDFSNLRIGVDYNSKVGFLYTIGSDRQVSTWVPTDAYRQNPQIGLVGCQPWLESPTTIPKV
jgi:hypothetical protein